MEKLKFYQLNPHINYSNFVKHGDIKLPKLVDKLNRELKREEDKKIRLKKKKDRKNKMKTKMKIKRGKQPK